MLIIWPTLTTPMGFIPPDVRNAAEIANMVAAQLVEIVQVRMQLGLRLSEDYPPQSTNSDAYNG